jgi:hypothetical protein
VHGPKLLHAARSRSQSMLRQPSVTW